MDAVPHFLIDLRGRCTHASCALGALLQCGIDELLGDGWRVRLSPFAESPFNARRLLELAEARTPMRLHNPTSDVKIVTRFRTVTDPLNADTATGLFGQVQVVRVHRRKAATVAALFATLLSA